jgi:hypothetical protein
MHKYHTNLAGLAFRPAEAKDVVRLLRPGHQLELEREPENPWDENAIKVYALVIEGTTQPIPTDADEQQALDAESHFIGYVEKLVNGPVAHDLDAGLTFTAHVEESYDDYDQPPRSSMWAKPLIAIETFKR